MLPKNKGLCAINGHQGWDDDDIITKVIVKANISYDKSGLFTFFTSIITESVVEASFKGSNTSNVTKMNDMFWACRGLTSLDLSGWDTSKVTDMNGMFNSCFKLKKIKMIGCSPDTIENIRTHLTAEDIKGFTIIQ